MALTKRQQEVLDYVQAHMDEKGYPPTVREIGEGVGLASPSTVHRHLEKLEQGGHLTRDPSKPRAMLVGIKGGAAATPPPPEFMLPLVGAVAAGSPILAEEHVEDHVAAPFAADYLLRVRCTDIDAAKAGCEPQFGGLFSRWKYLGKTKEPDGTKVLEYSVQPIESVTPGVIKEILRAVPGQVVVAVELRQ